MKIKFENFGYYESKSLEISDKGIFLFHGKTGSGKSTILKGISHAFFGNIEKPYKHGTKECTVYLEYKDLNIKRHNNPSYLIVHYHGDKYEGKSAQGIINDYLGLDKRSFVSSSWFRDPIGSSIISLPPCEQLEYIEKIVFENSNSKNFLENTNSKIKEIKDEILQLEGEIKAYEDQISSSKVEYISNESMTKVKECVISLKEQDREYSSTISECTKFIKLNRQKINNLKDEIDRQKKIVDRLNTIETNISTLEEELSELSEKIMSEDELSDNDVKISLCLDEIFNLECYSKYKEYIENYKKLKDDYILEKQNKISKLEKQLEDIGSSKDLEEKLNKSKDPENYLTILKISFSKFRKMYPDQKINSTTKLCSFLSEKIDEHNDNLKKIQKELYKSTSIYQDTHNCPSCNKSLVFDETELVLGDEVTHADHVIQRYQKEMRTKHNLEFILRDIKYFSRLYNSSKNSDLRDRLFSSKKLEQNIEEIKNEKIPNSILEFKNKVLEMKKNIPKGFKFEGDVEIKISELKDRLNNLKEIKNIGWNERSNFIRKEKTLRSLQIELNKYQKSIDSDSDHENKILQIEKEIDEMNENVSKYQDLRNDILLELKEQSILEQKIKKYENYQRLESILHKLNNKLSSLNNDCKSYLRFRECLKKAKLLAVEDMVHTINVYSKKYLESMFIDEHIDIKLYIDYSSDTLKIKNEMIFNGEIYSKLNDFSHGERQRIVLCFLLALNDALGSNILMLDESFTNVDHDTYTEIISFLKRENSDKLNIIVSQKICKGIFDNQFHFKKIF